MVSKKRSIFLWIFCVIFTIGIAYYQRVTGPSYPVSGHKNIAGRDINFKLLRTSDAEGNEKIKIQIPDTSFHGTIDFKRFKSNDAWTKSEMKQDGNMLIAELPHQPPAGKIIYSITLRSGTDSQKLTPEPVVIRFKGDVPLYILIPHILLMFLAMLYSSRTGLEAVFNGVRTYRYTIITTICLFLGGAILGPIVQKFAFGAYWTGWPFGHDLTDNKTLVALLIWIVALIVQLRNKKGRAWVIAAAIILLAVYLIPHSVLGSEIDYTQATPK